jgi:hypothetical protein
VHRIHGADWYNHIWVKNGDTVRTSEMSFIRNDGLRSGISATKGDSITAVDSTLVFKYPTKVGESYSSGVEDSTKVLSIDTLISVPAGKFHCICYQEEAQGVVDESRVLWFVSPGVGWVKEVAYSRFRNGRAAGHEVEVWKWELSQFRH